MREQLIWWLHGLVERSFNILLMAMRRKLTSVFCLFVCCLKTLYCLLYWDASSTSWLSGSLHISSMYPLLLSLPSSLTSFLFCICLASSFGSDIPYVLTGWPLQLHTRDLRPQQSWYPQQWRRQRPAFSSDIPWGLGAGRTWEVLSSSLTNQRIMTQVHYSYLSQMREERIPFAESIREPGKAQIDPLAWMPTSDVTWPQ